MEVLRTREQKIIIPERQLLLWSYHVSDFFRVELFDNLISSLGHLSQSRFVKGVLIQIIIED